MTKPGITFRVVKATTAAVLLFGLSGCGSLHLSDRSPRDLADLPHQDKAMLRLGDASRDAGDCTAAVRFYRIAASKGDKPNEIAAARIGAADCELASGALAEAERDYRAALGDAAGAGAAELGLGRVRLIQERPAEALQFFDAAIKHGMANAVALNDRGVTLDELKRHRDAQQSYRAGLAKFPNDRALRNNLGLSLAMTGDFAEAERLLRPLADDVHATARTRENLALVLGLKGDTAGADRVSRPDLDAAALANNARYYEYARGAVAEDDDRPKAAPVAPVSRAPMKPLLPPFATDEPPVPKQRQAAAKPTHREQAKSRIASRHSGKHAPAHRRVATKAGKHGARPARAVHRPATSSPKTASAS